MLFDLLLATNEMSLCLVFQSFNTFANNLACPLTNVKKKA